MSPVRSRDRFSGIKNKIMIKIKSDNKIKNSGFSGIAICF